MPEVLEVSNSGAQRFRDYVLSLGLVQLFHRSFLEQKYRYVLEQGRIFFFFLQSI